MVAAGCEGLSRFGLAIALVGVAGLLALPSNRISERF
jgi:hypothetical protein